MTELTIGGAPNGHAIAVMVLTVVALFLFTRERLPLEVTSLLLLAILAVMFTLFPYPGLEPGSLFLGFGHEALIAVCGLMVLGQGLVHTGAKKGTREGRGEERGERSSPSNPRDLRKTTESAIGEKLEDR
jgi:di/tricarboxylate transporter